MRIIEWQPRHAKLLADLWNASDEGWPMGLVRLRPKTAVEAREWERRTDSIVRFLAMDGRRPIGYARLFEWWRSPDATYVQWLNVDPADRGKGVGKALILKTIERTRAEGYPREDLHTWPGNDRAMPLYKRTGFMWVPGSHAYLQNYLPLLLSYGPGKRFFARHDWYATLQRDLKRDHDEDRLRGIDVFVYRFRAGRERLEAAIDRNARGVMAFEDREVRAEAWIPKATLVKGAPGAIHWYVENKGRAPLDIRIEADGPRGVRVRTPAPFRLRPGRRRELRGSVSIPTRLEDAPSGWACPAIETRWIVGGRTIPLRSGFRPVAAVDLAWEDGMPRVPAPGQRRVALVLRNQSGGVLRGVLTLRATGLRLTPSRLVLRLGKEATRRLMIRVDNPSEEAATASIQLRFSAKNFRVEKTLALPCLPPGGTVAYRRKEDWVLQSPSLQFVSASVGAKGALYVPDGTLALEGFWLLAGPPYEPFDGLKSRWEGRFGESGAPEIVRTFASRRRPGLLLEQRWRIVGERILELRTAVENHGPEPWSVGLAATCERGDESSTVTIPTDQGPVTEAVMEFEWPDQRGDVPLGRLLHEGWLHVGNDEGGYGVVWEPTSRRDAPKLELTGWDLPQWATPIVRLRPKGRHEFPRVWLVTATDWREVRDLWSLVAGRQQTRELSRLGSLQMDLKPSVVLASPVAEVTATLRSLRHRPTAGAVRVETGGGVRAVPDRWFARDVRLGKDWTKAFRIRGDGPRADAARIRLEDPNAPREWEVPVVVSDGRGIVRVRGPREQREVSNGALSFVASATHAGALTSLRSGRHEYLISSYPKPGSFAWFRPFYGGLYPAVFTEEWPGSLYKQRFRVRLARRGTWTGLLLSTRANEADLPKGTEVRIEYLTRPGSPLLAAILHVRNRTRERQTFTAGFWAFLGVDGVPVFEAEFERLGKRFWPRAPWGRWSVADGGFALFRAPKVETAIAVIAAAPAELEVADLKEDGRHGIVEREVRLAPGEEGHVLAMFVLGPREQAPAYRVLRDLTLASFEATRAR